MNKVQVRGCCCGIPFGCGTLLVLAVALISPTAGAILAAPAVLCLIYGAIAQLLGR
jgi:hypothetical protein